MYGEIESLTIARTSGSSFAPITLETDRLRLLPVSIDHVDTLHQIWTDADVRRYLWDDVEIDRQTAAAVVDQNLSDWSSRRYGLWLITDKQTNDAIGFVGFRSSEDANEPELLFGVLPGSWHRGIATEAAVAALRYLFEDVGASAAWAATDPPNTASVRVMERIGMVFDRHGKLNELDAVFYRITDKAR